MDSEPPNSLKPSFKHWKYGDEDPPQPSFLQSEKTYILQSSSLVFPHSSSDAEIDGEGLGALYAADVCRGALRGRPSTVNTSMSWR